MAALGIDFSDHEPMTVHVSAPGRFNLVGQQVSDKTRLARENRDAAIKDYDRAIEAYERQEIDLEGLLAFRRIYDLAEAWYLFVLASNSYAKSVSMLINGEIDYKTQDRLFWNMITAGTTFRSL